MKWVRVTSEKDAVRFLTYLFHKGWKWAGGNKSPHHTNFLEEVGEIIYQIWDDGDVMCLNEREEIRDYKRLDECIELKDFFLMEKAKFPTFVEIEEKC